MDEQTKPLDFGDYCWIEQKRFGVPNEMYKHKVIGRLESNGWMDIPVSWDSKEVAHKYDSVVIAAVCCGVGERKIVRYREIDCKRSPTGSAEHVQMETTK